MAKFSLVLSILALVTSAEAKTFVCVSKMRAESGQTYVAGELKSATTIHSVNYGRRKATDGSANKVYIKDASADADANYRPTRYRDFNRFEIGWFDNGDSGVNVTLLLPREIESFSLGERFDGVVLSQSPSGGGRTAMACFLK